MSGNLGLKKDDKLADDELAGGSGREPLIHPSLLSFVLRRNALMIAVAGGSLLACLIERQPLYLIFSLGFLIRPVVEFISFSNAPEKVSKATAAATKPLRLAFLFFCVFMLLKELAKL